MGEKKRTFTCKVCGGEHAGLICTKFTSVRVLPAKRAAVPAPLMLPAPAVLKDAKKAKTRRKKRKKPGKPKMPTAPPAGAGP